MRDNETGCPRSICWTVLLVAVAVLSGCATADRGALGKLQVGDAGGTCSFLTTIFAGPNVGRGRNEGHLKSSGEITSLFGPFGMEARRIHWRLAALGMGLEEYHAMTYAPPALGLYEDTLIIARTVRERQLVPEADVQAYYRLLLNGNFLNTDVLIDTLEAGGVSKKEVREQFWRWVGYTYDNYDLDYYLFSGNQNMVRKLHTREIISKEEATYLLARWFLERTTYEPSMLEDLEWFGIVNEEEIALLVTLELAYLDFLSIESGAREKLIVRHNTVYGKVGKKAKWSLTIPPMSKIEALAPSLRNRYERAYDADDYIPMETLEVPKPLGKYKGYDPRIAMSMNDGRRLSMSERLSRWWLGHIFSAFGAASGDTQTAYVFKRRLHSPASKFLVELVALGREKGVLTEDQHIAYVTACVQKGYCSRWLYLAAKEYKMPVLSEMVDDTKFWRRIFVMGVDYEDYRVITNLADGAHQETISNLMRFRLSDFETSLNAITIKCAEQTGMISRRESDALLVAHFYLLLEQIADPSWVPTHLQRGWRMRAQREEVKRAGFEFKAKKAVEAVREVRASHDNQ